MLSDSRDVSPPDSTYRPLRSKASVMRSSDRPIGHQSSKQEDGSKTTTFF